MVPMELVSVIRHKVLTEGVPIRDVARQLGLSRNTIRRYVRAKVVPVPRPVTPQRRARGHGATRVRPRRAGPGRLLRGLGRGRERAPEGLALSDALDALGARLRDD